MTSHCANAQACDDHNPKFKKDEPNKKKPQEIFKVSKLILWFLGRFSMVKMLEWREREHEEEDYLLGMTRENSHGPLVVWVTKVLQDSGHEGPVETTGVLGSHVGCEREGISCGCPHTHHRYRGYLFPNRTILSWFTGDTYR
jgi:hypothetical protein